MAGLLVNVQAIDDLDLPLKLVYGYLDVGPSSFQFVGVCSARLPAKLLWVAGTAPGYPMEAPFQQTGAKLALFIFF
eukprot:3566296-Rhodomonas_salina.2